MDDSNSPTPFPLETWHEWFPLSPLLDQLPDHFQRGLSTSELHLTCVAALPDHLVLGTNVGLVYLAHLPSLNLMRLKCESALEGVVCVAGVRTVEDMIAAGGTEGTITIFQLPRTGHRHTSSSPSGDVPCPPVKRFTITTTHSTRLTALTWSLNGLMLFSGDMGGLVGLVEVDPTNSQCTARPLLSEPSPIVQLSYLHRRLAVCTHERALVYSVKDGTHVQVGRKARKHPGSFGCVWAPDAPINPGLLFTARPGMRLWVAEGGGEVLHTHIIRDLPPGCETVLLNPYAEAARDGEHFSFGLVHSLGSSSIVSHTRHWLIAFDTAQRRVLAHTGRFRRITGVAVCQNRIFVLEGSRTVNCLSTESPKDIGSARIPRPSGLGLLELTQLGNKIVTQGSGLFDQLAKVGSSVAAKVTEHAGPSVLTGTKGGGGGGDVREIRREIGKMRESPKSSSSSSSISPPPPPRLASSFSSSSSSSSASSSSSTTINNNTIFSSVGMVVEEVEEAYSGSGGDDDGGGGGDDGGDVAGGESCGPLVTRGRTKRKRARKNAATASPDTPSDTSPGPATPLTQPHPSSDDITSNIQEKESLLASILDMDCLRLDHPAPPEPESPPVQTPEDLIHPNWGWEGGGSPGGTQCSTPSTIKEVSPAPSSLSGNEDFYARLYQRHLSLSSVDSGEGTHCSPGSRGRRQEEEEEEEEDVERLPSNVSEDHSSCLSYGPPSGSSLTPQPPPHPSLTPHPPSHPRPAQGEVVTLNDSSDVADITWSYSHQDDVEEEDEEEEEEEVLSGGWVRRSLPGRAVSLAASHTCRAFVNTSGHLYLAGPHPSDPWRKVTLTRDACQVSLATNGQVGWVVVGGGEAYAFLPPPSDSPSPAAPTKMAAVARDVHLASVGDERTWYLDVDMKVCVCPSISEEANSVQVSGGGGGAGVEVAVVVTKGQVVWALTSTGQLMVRIGVNSSSGGRGSVGQEWGVMASPNAPHNPANPLVGLALGQGRGWVVDAQGRLFFREGVCDEFPQGDDLRWWQVVTSRYMVGEDVRVGGVLLATSHQGLWLAELGAQTCCVHRPAVTGHCWEVFSEEVWSVACAEGLYTTQGALCCLLPLGHLFLINPNTASCVPLELPSSNSNSSSSDDDAADVVVCVSQRPEVLWVLTSSGQVFIRAGLSASSLLGTHWEELDLTQIGDIQLCHISCGTEVVWGVDTRGGVYMRQGPLTPCHSRSLPPAWIQVEPSVGSEVEFTKVYVGARLHLVWALDSCMRVYVRQAIYPELPVGLSWVCVPGLMATHLSISEDQVVALTPSGEAFRRTGVSGNNFIGDAWERIPGRLAGLSVTTDNTLWGLNTSGHLCRLVTREMDCNTTSTSYPHHGDLPPRPHSLSLSSDHEDWEVL